MKSPLQVSDYKAMYHRMTNDELLHLGKHRESLCDDAVIAYEAVMAVRGLGDKDVEAQAEHVSRGAIPPAKRPVASRWARLGIFMAVAFASAIMFSLVFFKGDSATVESLTERSTKISLQVGLAGWALSEVVAGRWLTLKRTVIVAIALHFIGVVLVGVFLGKPLATKVEELTEEQVQVDRRFTESATGKMLLQPQSFASPQVAANSLAEFEQYVETTEKIDKRKEALLLRRDDAAVRPRWAAYFEATRELASRTEELYRFAADPSQHVRVENGVVAIDDPDGYNKRMDAVHDAAEKLQTATAALKEPVPER